MTTPARPVRCDIPALHAAFAPSTTLQQERRALYQLATELLEGGCSQILDPDVIDSPLARNRIGDALAGRADLVYSTFVGISAMADASSAQGLRVASRPEANTLLAQALDTVGLELDRQQAALGPPVLLTKADGDRFTSALDVLCDGVALARSVSPELIDDLLAHVALVGIIDPQRAGRLASASPRAFPGLVLLQSPRSSIEAAEALVHEGAHQKLFELAITRDLLNAGSDRCPPFHPPWGSKDRRWPLEQTLAAFHAYSCLARFAHDAGVSAEAGVLGPDSLLPWASDRSTVLGHWLLDKSAHLGTDAHLLLDGLIGLPSRTAHPAENRSGPVAADYVVDTRLEFRRCSASDRVLVGRPSHPPQLYWISDEAATVLELLAQKSVDDVADTLAQRWCIQRFKVNDRLTALLSDLYVSGLVKLRDTRGGGS